jgi:threonylcarbamoyladenosine tRNA methylthiotransferase MtaB
MPTAAFTTVGCKVNQYETQRILETFEEAGFRVVPFDAPADVYVINSCSVTSIAEGKSRYTIRRASRANPAAVIIATGCAAQMAVNQGEALAGVHVVVPNAEKMDTLRYLFKAYPGYARAAYLNPRPDRCSAPAFQGRTRATLKIQDGCNVFCTYCSIPYTRPYMRSRPYREVLEEAQRLAGMGYREAVLTGVLIGAYGPETGSGGPCFEGLVELLAERSGLERIRISSIEMRQVTFRLMKALAAGTVVPHLHIPLQSGDDDVLRDMNRPYGGADFRRLCEVLYDVVPDLSITTDVMVGFPTETDERFASSVRVCEEVAFLKGHIFRFSPRQGTPAAEWGDPVPAAEKQSRSENLMDVTARTGEAHIRRFLGRSLRVLVECKSTKTGLLGGFTDNYIEVHFAGPSSLVRQTCFVTLGDVRGGVAYGELAVPEA